MNESEVRAIVLTALAQARADGDEKSAARLESLLAKPQEAAALVKELAAK